MLEHLMGHHQYLAILIGAIFQGEAFALLAGLLAYKGHANLLLAIVSTAAGALVGDLLYYGLGRLTGMAVVQRSPFLAAPVAKAQQLMKRYGAGSIFLVRYIQGARALSALLLGAVPMHFRRFLLLTWASCLLWAVLSCSAGYLLAGSFTVSALTRSSYQGAVLTGIVLLLLAQLATYCVRQIHSAKAP